MYVMLRSRETTNASVMMHMYERKCIQSQSNNARHKETQLMYTDVDQVQKLNKYLQSIYHASKANIFRMNILLRTCVS